MNVGDELWLKTHELAPSVDRWLTHAPGVFELHLSGRVTVGKALRAWLALDAQSLRMRIGWTVVVAALGLAWFAPWVAGPAVTLALSLVGFHAMVLSSTVKGSVEGTFVTAVVTQFLPHPNSEHWVDAVVATDRVAVKRETARELMGAWKAIEIAYVRPKTGSALAIAFRQPAVAPERSLV